MEIRELHTLYKETHLVDTDTRKIREGSIFFALKGANFNGNKFAQQALDKGARYAVVDEAEYATHDQMILVEDALTTLQKLATFHRNSLKAPIISMTGSNGKTTTKELIHAVLKTQYKAEATSGNLNNHIGVPLTLLSFTETTEIGIVEMGANHQKEIEFLSNIAEPDYGYITNFGKAHLEGFGGVEGVIKGKSELYTFLRENNRTVFVNPKDEKQLELTQGMQRILFGNDVKVISTHPFVQLQYKDETIQTQLVGEYNVSNMVVAITIGEHFNISTKNIKKALEAYESTNNRSQLMETEKNKILLDAYNANPSSVSLALENFSKSDHPQKIAILGDMFELGDVALEEHQAMVDLATSLDINRAIFVGSHYYETQASEKYETFEDLQTEIEANPIENSFVFIKGSRGMALERLLKIID
jgi:UDP-N-acetylmuramoyl-tripeptide--D-alanyl-D-alanine ligase